MVVWHNCNAILRRFDSDSHLKTTRVADPVMVFYEAGSGSTPPGSFILSSSISTVYQLYGFLHRKKKFKCAFYYVKIRLDPDCLKIGKHT